MIRKSWFRRLINYYSDHNNLQIDGEIIWKCKFPNMLKSLIWLNILEKMINLISTVSRQP